ncbi:aminotransferase class III-fold pyridoxal phosphate-dependent enzyme [Streptomyces roseolilacinus]|uniref:Diaminobutyrate--2-oxoglutarate transaminase n=1 Tax=Streptomyces roseolilacinus TaxID=66904 RepID=A0A918B158_9ACTN|nr:aminotransferase class III-fold pyridoxal phosphate-dependent enzyme [Streptomyces roseolilacinus]GGP98611.1 diaminobutyrate--2-oxoglutarate aminotransferase [Streptomyces roseolilacinus]
MAVTEPATAAPPAGPGGVPRRRPRREPAAHPYARPLPVVPVRARGVTVEGADGRRYLDCTSGAGALGHNHPVVLEAVRRFVDSGAPLHALDLATPVRDAFTAELLATLPPAFARGARVRFCDPAGTDAVDAALALARAATGRTGVLTFTADAHRDPVAPGPPGAPGTVRVARPPHPDAYRCPFGGAEAAARRTGLPPGGPGTRAEPPAAVVVEPVRGGGVVPAPDDWLRRVRESTAARSVPLIADETLTGLGRTGAFWAVEHSGVVPDALAVSRVLGGSLPLSVIVHRSALDPGGRGGRADGFRGNRPAMAAGTATLAYVRENRLAERAAVLGARLLARLRELAAAHACVGDVRGRGLVIGVELADAAAGPGGASPPAPALAEAVRRECLDRGLIVGTGGPHSGVVRLLPPLTLTDEQAAAVLDRFADALAAVERAFTR